MRTVICEQILIKDSPINTVLLSTAQSNLIIASASRGFIMCGYLNIDIAEKLGDAACIVSGVSTVEQLMVKPVVKITKQAQELGICLGDTGHEALEKML